MASTTMDKLFRREAIVSDVDLRVDLAKTVSKVILDDETIDLDTQETHVRGSLAVARGELDHEVTGNYLSTMHATETRMVTGKLKETVNGGVDLRAQLESETLMAGAYVNTLNGPYLRLCAWADFLAWGGWVEADLVRCEIAGAMIRAYWIYAHAVGARLLRAMILIDDFEKRLETFGVLVDMDLVDMKLASPGSGDTLEA